MKIQQNLFAHPLQMANGMHPGEMTAATLCRHFEELTETDDEYDDDYVSYTASGRLCMHSSQKRTRAFEAQTMLAGSSDFIAAGMEGTVKDEVPPATVLWPSCRLCGLLSTCTLAPLHTKTADIVAAAQEHTPSYRKPRWMQC